MSGGMGGTPRAPTFANPPKADKGLLVLWRASAGRHAQGYESRRFFPSKAGRVLESGLVSEGGAWKGQVDRTSAHFDSGAGGPGDIR